MHARGRLVRYALAVHFQCHLNHGYSRQPNACARQRVTAVPCSLRWCSSLPGMTPASSSASRTGSRPASPCRAMLAASRAAIRARRPTRPPRSSPSSTRHRTTRRSWPRRIRRSCGKTCSSPSAPPARLWHMHGGDQLVLAQPGGVGALHVVLRRQHADPVRAGDLQRRAQADHGQHPVGRRIGMRQAAAQRAAIADGAVGDAGATCCNGVPRSSSCTPSSISAWVTAAPTRSPPSCRVTVRSSARPEMSMTTGGRASRRFSMGPSDCPPAMSLARPSCARSARKASCSEPGRVYSNAAAFMPSPPRWRARAGGCPARWRRAPASATAACAAARPRPAGAAHR